MSEKIEAVKIFENIRLLAIIQKRSLKDLMEECEIDRQLFYSAEKRGSIDTEKLIKIATALKVSPILLFKDVNGAILRFIERMNSEPSVEQLLQP